MQKSISFENLETAQDIRYIRTQFSVLLSRMMCKFLMLAQKNISLLENIEKAVNMKSLK